MLEKKKENISSLKNMAPLDKHSGDVPLPSQIYISVPVFIWPLFSINKSFS